MIVFAPLKRVSIIAILALTAGACETKKDATLQTGAAATAASTTAVSAADPVFDTVASLENANDPKKLFADPSIAKRPAKNLVYGNGQALSIEYDGSKSKSGDSVFFDLTMIRPDGIVVQVGSDTFDGRVPGRVFTKSNKVFNSDAEGRPGFVEIKIVQNSGLDSNGKIVGKNLMIGRFPIKFQVGT